MTIDTAKIRATNARVTKASEDGDLDHDFLFDALDRCDALCDEVDRLRADLDHERSLSSSREHEVSQLREEVAALRTCHADVRKDALAECVSLILDARDCADAVARVRDALRTPAERSTVEP